MAESVLRYYQLSELAHQAEDVSDINISLSRFFKSFRKQFNFPITSVLEIGAGQGNNARFFQEEKIVRYLPLLTL